MHQKNIFVFLSLLLSLFVFSCANSKQKLSNSLAEKNGQVIENPSTKGGDFGLNLNVKKIILNNGLTVLLYENHQLPICAFFTFFEVGARHETDGMHGGTHFLEHMMFKMEKFDSTIEGHGGSTNAYTSSDFTVYHQDIPKSILPEVIKLEAERMQNITLIEDQFESERKVILDEKLKSDNRPDSKLFHKMMENVFDKTPYGKAVIGTDAQIKEITIENMRAYFKTYYTPNNAILVIVGDIDVEQTISLVKASYEKISISPNIKEIKNEKERDELYKHQGKFNREVKIAGNSPTPMFNLAFKGGPVGTRKSLALDLLSSIIGDGQSSYLNQQYVANKKPMLESVYTHNYTLKKNGVFYIAGQ